MGHAEVTKYFYSIKPRFHDAIRNPCSSRRGETSRIKSRGQTVKQTETMAAVACFLFFLLGLWLFLTKKRQELFEKRLQGSPNVPSGTFWFHGNGSAKCAVLPVRSHLQRPLGLLYHPLLSPTSARLLRLDWLNFCAIQELVVL